MSAMACADARLTSAPLACSPASRSHRATAIGAPRGAFPPLRTRALCTQRRASPSPTTVLQSGMALHRGTPLAPQAWAHQRPAHQRLGPCPGFPAVQKVPARRSIGACRARSRRGDDSRNGSGNENGKGNKNENEDEGRAGKSGSGEMRGEDTSSSSSKESTSSRPIDPSLSTPAAAAASDATSAAEASDQEPELEGSGPRSTRLQLRARLQGAGKARQARQRVGYHPLEDLGAHERGGRGGAFAKRHLSHAEVARTVAESHSDAILVGTTVAGSKIQGFVERTTVVADANFVVEYDGEVFLQMEDAEGHLRILEVQGTRCGVIVGLDSAGDPSFDHILLGLEEDGDGDVLIVGEEDDDGSDSDSDDEDEGPYLGGLAVDDGGGPPGSQVWGRDSLGGLMDPSDLVPQILLGDADTSSANPRTTPSSSSSSSSSSDRSSDRSSQGAGGSVREGDGALGDEGDSARGPNSRGFARGEGGGGGSGKGEEEAGERGGSGSPGDEDEQDFSSGGLSGSYGMGDAEDGESEDPYAEAEDFAARLYDAVTFDPWQDMRQPRHRLLMRGVLYRATPEEEMRCRESYAESLLLALGLSGAEWDTDPDDVPPFLPPPPLPPLPATGEEGGGLGSVVVEAEGEGAAEEGSAGGSSETKGDGSEGDEEGASLAGSAGAGGSMEGEGEGVEGVEGVEGGAPGEAEGGIFAFMRELERRETAFETAQRDRLAASSRPPALAADSGNGEGEGEWQGQGQESSSASISSEGTDGTSLGVGDSDSSRSSAAESSISSVNGTAKADDASGSSSNSSSDSSRNDGGMPSGSGAGSSSSSSSSSSNSSSTSGGILKAKDLLSRDNGGVMGGRAEVQGTEGRSEADQGARGGEKGALSDTEEAEQAQAQARAGAEEGEADTGSGDDVVTVVEEEGISLVLRREEGEEDSSDDESDDEGSEDEDGFNDGSTYYKLVLTRIVLVSSNGSQVEVDVPSWNSARPDLLTLSAVEILEKANGVERARACMRELVARTTGRQPDEAWMSGIDHLGIDLRVRFGAEVKQMRFPFRHPATNERSAERLLDELLRPRKRIVHPKGIGRKTASGVMGNRRKGSIQRRSTR